MECIITHPQSAEDAKRIAEFQVLMALETEGVTLDLAIVEKGVEMAMADPENKGRYFIAKTGDKVVGSLFVTKEWSDWHCQWYWWVQSVFIHSDFRRQGIYHKMYQTVVDEAKPADVHQVRLYVDRDNVRAQKTYQAQGMHESHYLLYEQDI